MNERMNTNVEELLSSINNDTAANNNEIESLRQQISEVDEGFQELISQNDSLQNKVNEMKNVYAELREREKQN